MQKLTRKAVENRVQQHLSNGGATKKVVKNAPKVLTPEEKAAKAAKLAEERKAVNQERYQLAVELSNTPRGDRAYAERLAKAVRAGDLKVTEELFDLFQETGVSIAQEEPATAVVEYGTVQVPSFVKVDETPAPVAAAEPATVIFDGIYTMVSGKDGSHRTFRIRTQASDATFGAGKQVISLLTGSDNYEDYTQVGFVIDGHLKTWKKSKGTMFEKCCQALVSFLRGGAAAAAYKANGYRVEESRHCFRCHRLLTTPESIAAGIGPECIKKGI